ncbi:MAG TPA: ankyrin repeat domain-containing protein [Gammaproteobacteria bacterium]
MLARSSARGTRYTSSWRQAFLSAILFAFAGTCAAAESTLPELVELGQREAALRALGDGADVDARGPDGATALLWAAHKGDRELVKALLERDANPDAANDYGVTPLAAAAVEADAEIIGALLEVGADVEAANPEGQTALMVVARTGRVEAARLLLEHGANVNAHESFGGQTALMWAAAQKHPDMIRLLVENGADVDARGLAHDWERRVTAEPRIKIMQTGGFTPLLYAAREGCVACVEPLVAGGADIDLSDPYGMTPLVLALYNRQFDTAVALIESGADIEQWDWWGRSPLYLAIELNRIPDSRRNDLPALDTNTGLDVARLLLERGANVNMRLKHQPPLRNEPGDRGFTDGSPDVLVVSPGATALHVAAKASDDDAVKLLLEHGANVQVANVFGITPVMAAAGVGHWYGVFREFPTIGRYKTGADAVATMKLLLAAGATLDGRTTELSIGFQRPRVAGLTAAHGAAFQGWNEVIEFLHEQGAPIDAKQTSADGATPRDVALAEGHPETAALIERLLAAK